MQFCAAVFPHFTFHPQFFQALFLTGIKFCKVGTAGSEQPALPLLVFRVRDPPIVRKHTDTTDPGGKKTPCVYVCVDSESPSIQSTPSRAPHCRHALVLVPDSHLSCDSQPQVKPHRGLTFMTALHFCGLTLVHWSVLYWAQCLGFSEIAFCRKSQ